ncbi:MAG: MFS transporter [Rhodospirillales bacterium]|nr:MFS transporter [Rhodospirillales bacterium]MBT4006164.1 MFS transporter [Rhodospirillales bacterium]MBT5076612.1 MFS transporter [Rhodospirillales bacterium]MBT5114345.1 MFS transporter [Rhodospirillales bacterium]MBT5672737.1 MFS transporter [Rhodospirillales bacterium]
MSEDKSPEVATPGNIPLRSQLPVYAAGIFSNGAIQLAAVVVPLWMLHVDSSPLMVGIALGSRQILPVLLSIHGGALMDRIGIRKVMIWFSILGAVTPFLFPLFPFFAAVILLQMLGGISAAMGWIGTQAQIGAVMKGEPKYAGRVTFFNRFGMLVGPPATGAAWDFAGPWGGFGFLGFWGIALTLSCLAMPKPVKGEIGSGDENYSRLTVREVLPRLTDYTSAFRLIAIPTVAFVIAVTLIRHSSNGIQTSFYVVWLESIGLTGTMIGTLISASAVLGSVGSISAGWLAKKFTAYRVLVVSVCLAILLIAITPMLGTFVLLLGAMGLRGGFMGVSQPLLISLMSQSSGRQQGKGVGLRTTVNRLSILVTPVIMGAMAEFIGIAPTFYVVGGFLVLLMLFVAFKSRNSFK